MAAHPGASLVDLTKGHVFISQDCLAELGFTVCFVTNQACDTVGVTLALLLEKLIVLHHVLLVTFTEEVSVIKMEKRFELASSFGFCLATGCTTGAHYNCLVLSFDLNLQSKLR